MRYITPFLLFTCFLVPAFSQSPLTWNKKTYAPTGTSVERADFNGDGFSDLLIYGGSTTSVILNNGNGTFDATHVFTTGPLQTVAFLDFNRDGKMDVAGCDRNGDLDILLGNGNGSLTLAQAISDSCSWVATADFNRDKNPDIAVGVPSQAADRSGNQVIVYLGDGRGQIASQVVNGHVDLPGVQGVTCILNGSAQAADFNNDSFADIAITASCLEVDLPDSALIVGKGDGTGHFVFNRNTDFNYAPGKHLRMGGINSFVADGRRDLYEVSDYHLSNGNNGSVLGVFINQGNGTFGFGEKIGPGNNNVTITAATVADIDSDGIKDIVAIYKTTTDSGDSFEILFLKGLLNGDYNLTRSPLATAVNDMTWGDFDKNGTPDLVMLRPASTDVWRNTTAKADICPNSV
ncbi:MAG TPA: VCBS repeat-containing protein, partial [Terriglobales bacterium]